MVEVSIEEADTDVEDDDDQRLDSSPNVPAFMTSLYSTNSGFVFKLNMFSIEHLKWNLCFSTGAFKHKLDLYDFATSATPTLLSIGY